MPSTLFTTTSTIFEEQIRVDHTASNMEREIIPLTELVASGKVVECDDPLVLVKDIILDSRLAFDGGRHIPKIIHVTSRSRCLHKTFADNLKTWHLKDHSFFMHDDEAMDKLLYRDWPEFPQLQQVLKCLKHGGAVKADVWRILVLWEYGGIYTDIDNRPALFNEDTITADDQAFFVVDVLYVFLFFFWMCTNLQSTFFICLCYTHCTLFFLIFFWLFRL
jgi:mannosyltransferase OCH1-like enzyme